jgi:hypothetical protein
VTPGCDVAVVLPPLIKAKRCRLLRVEPNGDITVIHPRNGGLRTVHPDAVRRVYEPKAGSR